MVYVGRARLLKFEIIQRIFEIRHLSAMISMPLNSHRVAILSENFSLHVAANGHPSPFTHTESPRPLPIFKVDTSPPWATIRVNNLASAPIQPCLQTNTCILHSFLPGRSKGLHVATTTPLPSSRKGVLLKATTYYQHLGKYPYKAHRTEGQKPRGENFILIWPYSKDTISRTSLFKCSFCPSAGASLNNPNTSKIDYFHTRS